MIFGNRPLREITEVEIRELIDAEMAEHLRLEYKSVRYEDTDRGRREFLQDICMFANAAGGVLLIGVSELRGDDGQPSGVPDPDADLGIASANPEAELLAYDARIVACIEERLAIESHAVRVEGDRFVMAFRVASSVRKPHCVRFQGHVYFPSRRERNRYEMDLREIKEQTMRAASQLQRAEDLLDRELSRQVAVGWPSLFVAQLPVFYRDFLVDVTNETINHEIQSFDVSGRERPHYRLPIYTFEGLQRHDPDDNTDVILHRNGMLTLKAEIPGQQLPAGANQWQFEIAALDLLLHEFGVKVAQFYLAAELDSPAVLRAEILTSMHLQAQWNRRHAEGRVPVNNEHRFIFPPIEIPGPIENVDRIIRPICDHMHQMFGRERSPHFDANGRWMDPRL